MFACAPILPRAPSSGTSHYPSAAATRGISGFPIIKSVDAYKPDGFSSLGMGVGLPPCVPGSPEMGTSAGHYERQPFSRCPAGRAGYSALRLPPASSKQL